MDNLGVFRLEWWAQDFARQTFYMKIFDKE